MNPVKHGRREVRSVRGLARAGGVSAWVLGLGFLFSGCSLTQPQADPTRFFVLSTNATGPRTASVATGDAPRVRLRQVELADYIRGRPLIVRRGDNEIEFRDYARWSEPLEHGIGRMLREELLARGAAEAVLIPGARGGNVAYDHDLSVRLLACEGAASGEVIFRAGWVLSAAGDRTTILARGDFRAAGLTWDGKSEGSLVGQLSQAVVGLADEIAAGLSKK